MVAAGCNPPSLFRSWCSRCLLGVFADNYDRRTVMLIANFLHAGRVGLLAFLAFQGLLSAVAVAEPSPPVLMVAARHFHNPYLAGLDGISSPERISVSGGVAQQHGVSTLMRMSAQRPEVPL